MSKDFSQTEAGNMNFKGIIWDIPLVLSIISEAGPFTFFSLF